MSFLKKLGRQKSVDLEEETKKKEEKEKAREMKRSKRHSVHVSARREIPDAVAEETKSKDDSFVGIKSSRKREAELKERERRKFKDMSGIVLASPNEYPVFIVHYLGRMPADAEYGREAVEEPVHQLCMLREKQKLPKTLLAFNVEGMMCKEVSGPFLKPKKEGLTFFIPLHHITYGVGSLTHPQVFAVITKMTDDPSPANQVLVLHAFLCNKPEESQALTYWQLQAYIEAFEDLKRKRMLKMRRNRAMSQPNPEDGTPLTHATGEERNDHREKGKGERQEKCVLPSQTISTPSPTAKESLNNGTDVVKPNRTNSMTSTTSSSSSGSTTKKITPNMSRKPSDSRSSGSHISDSITSDLRQQKLEKVDSNALPKKRGPPPDLRGPPVDSGAAYDAAAVHVNNPNTTGLAGSSIPGIKPRRSSESDNPARSTSFESRISELQSLVEMDAEKLKMLMISEYPTLSRKLYYKMDKNGVVTQHEIEEVDGATAEATITPTGEDSVV